MKCKNILITGATKGIGYSISKLLAKNNNVFIAGRNELKLSENVKKLQCKGFFSIDLSAPDAPFELYKRANETLNSIDVLINNAGLYVYDKVENTKDDDINSLINLNTLASYKLIKYVVPNMKKNKFGRIINIGSISGVVGEGNASLYSMTKSALLGMTKALALELAQDGITVNTINPGWVDTSLVNNENLNEEFNIDEIIEMIPQRRFVHPNEIAKMCEYLITDSAKGITGQSLNICAGLSIG